METDYYFEGPEKTLEVWFVPTSTPASGKLGKIGLRSIPRASWELLLKEVRCTILSETETEYMDSFVLSESSMFITPFRFILKTCGQTTLLHAVPSLLALSQSVGLTVIQELFFTRHHLRRPELQLYPHKSFDDEVKFLDQQFIGSAYSLGRVNDCNTCYVYTLDSDSSVDVPDQTLEILMSDLDVQAMANFYKSDAVQTFQTATEVGEVD